MRTNGWRFEVKLISTEALRSYVAHRGMTLQEVANKAGVSRQLVGLLHSGKRNSCKPINAYSIEKALDAPKGSLFLETASTVQRDTAPPAHTRKAA